VLRKIIAGMAGVIVGLSIASAGAEPQVLRVGVSAGPYAEILRFAAELAAKQELDVKVIEFTDWTLPNAALNQGDLELNNFQHQPYLDNQVAQRGYDLVSIAKSIVVPFGLYSKKITSLDQIKDGATSAIPNDPSNAARGLQNDAPYSAFMFAVAHGPGVADQAFNTARTPALPQSGC
jgi:D-methionine transport system substrate-binding protein